MSNSRHRGVAWVVLVAVVVSFQPWPAMAGSSSSPAARSPKQYITIPNSTPAARSATPAARSATSNPSRQIITPPVAPITPAVPNGPATMSGAAATPVGRKQIPTTQTAITPPSIQPLTYDELRENAVKAELNAQKAQLLYNQATAAEALQSSNLKSFAQKAGYAALLHPPLGTPVTGPMGRVYAEASKPMVRAGSIITDNSIDVQPCNQILGITLPSWTRPQFRTLDGKKFTSYSAAKEYVLKADLLKNPIQIGNTGKISQKSIGDAYYACLEIEGMSADLDFSKKLLDQIALNAAVTWKPIIKEYYSALRQKQDAFQAWQVAETNLIDLTAKMILQAESKDPNLEGLAIDAYGFLVASKLRYYYMVGYSKLLLPSESNMFDYLQIQKIFQDLSNGKIDTTGYRTSLYNLYNTATGPAALLRFDRALAAAAAYAASLKFEDKLTKRLAKAMADNATSIKSGALGLDVAQPNKGTLPINNTNSPIADNKGISWAAGINPVEKAPVISDSAAELYPVKKASVILDPAMAAISDRVTEVVFMLGVPILDRTKIYGVTPLWSFITNTAYSMDNYFFALKDQSKSAVVKNGGFDIYDKVAGWHKLQIEWVPIHTPRSFFHNEVDHIYEYKNNVGTYKTAANWSIIYPADSSCPHVQGLRNKPANGKYEYHDWEGNKNSPSSVSDLFYDCTTYMTTKLVSDSYLANDPTYEVLSQSTKALGPLPSSLLPKEILAGVKNVFGVSALNMLSVHDEFPPPVYCGQYNSPLCYTSNEYQSLLTLKKNSLEFADYAMKGLQADKAAGYPVGTFSKRMQNYTSVAMLFHPVSVGFGSCSIYETLFSPYNTRLGYSCIDYMRPLLELYKPSQKTSILFRELRRLNQWVADHIIPNANAESFGIEKSDDGGSGSGGGAIAVIATMVLNYFGYGSGSGSAGAGGGGDGGVPSASEIQAKQEASQAADKKFAKQMETKEVNLLNSTKEAIEKYLEGVQQTAQAISDALKKLLGLPLNNWNEFGANNQGGGVAMQYTDLVFKGDGVEMKVLTKGDFSVMKTLNDRSITTPINYNGKTYFPKIVNAVSQSQYVEYGGGDWYIKKVSVTYQSPDASELTELDSFLYSDVKSKDGQVKTINQGVYKITIMEGSDVEKAITVLHDLYAKNPDGTIFIQKNGSPAQIWSEVIDATFGGGGPQDTDPAAVNDLQKLIDDWVKKHPK